MIDTLLDADYREWVRGNQQFDKFVAHRRTFPRFFKFYDRLCDAFWLTYARTLCKIFGHKNEVTDDWYGPDSGGFYWSCTRGCGEGGKEVLY